MASHLDRLWSVIDVIGLLNRLSIGFRFVTLLKFISNWNRLLRNISCSMQSEVFLSISCLLYYILRKLHIS